MFTPICHICMADDDPDDYYLFEVALKEVNTAVRCSWFDTCAKLLEYLQLTDELPGVILLDMNMPGNDGHQCLIAIKKEARWKQIPVIIYSTSGAPHIMQQAAAAGAYRYCIKPSSIQQIKTLIGELLAILTPGAA